MLTDRAYASAVRQIAIRDYVAIGSPRDRNRRNAVFLSRELYRRCEMPQRNTKYQPPFLNLYYDAQHFDRTTDFPLFFYFFGIYVCVDSLPSDDGTLRLVFMLEEETENPIPF